jgi:hypothetical protein
MATHSTSTAAAAHEQGARGVFSFAPSFENSSKTLSASTDLTFLANTHVCDLIIMNAEFNILFRFLGLGEPMASFFPAFTTPIFVAKSSI